MACASWCGPPPVRSNQRNGFDSNENGQTWFRRAARNQEERGLDGKKVGRSKDEPINFPEPSRNCQSINGPVPESRAVGNLARISHTLSSRSAARTWHCKARPGFSPDSIRTYRPWEYRAGTKRAQTTAGRSRRGMRYPGKEATWREQQSTSQRQSNTDPI